MGIEALRRSKESYHPIGYLKKYSIGVEKRELIEAKM
jgi:hypothetical protein